jgi:hypothetical protein
MHAPQRGTNIVKLAAQRRKLRERGPRLHTDKSGDRILCRGLRGFE